MDWKILDEFISTRLSSHTAIAYESAIKSFAKTGIDSGIDIVTAQKRELRNLLRAWLRASSWSEKSQRQKIAGVQSFYAWLVKEDWRDDNPVEEISPMKQDEPKIRQFPTKDMAERILYWVVTHGTRKQELVIRILMESGVRVSELINLKYNDVNPSGLVLVRRAKRNKTRRTAIRESTASMLEAYRKSCQSSYTDYIFASTHESLSDKPMDVSAINHMLATVTAQAGLSQEEQKICSSPHAWRHYWATEHVRNNTHPSLLQNMGGWSSPQMIQTYMDANQLTPIAIK
jgi:integrase/recombinase XerD